MPQPPQSPPPAAATRTQLDQDTLRELRSVLGADFLLLVNTWLADSETRLTMLRTAAAAADAAALREAAHSFKGSSLNLGALRLADLCLAMETAARSGALTDVPALLAAIESEYRQVAPELTRRARV